MEKGGNKEIPMDRVSTGPAGSTLEIFGVTFDDDGDYICEASNGEGAPITYTSAIIVRAAPYWDPNPPDDTTIAPRESVTMTCQAGGSPASSISWLINGKPESEVEANPRRTITSGQGSGQIIVTNAEQSDSAVFQCVAKNIYGEEITSVFLNVLAIPAEIRKRPLASYEEAEGETVEMRCEPYGKPNPTVTWSFEGTKITPGGRFTVEEGGSDDGMLRITELEKTDSGMYNCNVTNDFGTDAASPRLIVRKQTTVTEGPGAAEVTANENIVLKCVVDSDPDLELVVLWEFEGVEIDTEVNKNRYKLGSDNSLTVITARKQDGGEYTCKAITTFKSDSSTSTDTASGTVTVLTIPDPPNNVMVVNTNDLQADISGHQHSRNTPITEYTISTLQNMIIVGES
ncbi:neuroglian-like [Amphiura filiformis]|uniref:neuroglian-like n=1 Tax=Amphiura filiformis TaxID=82378 RepID=UPI003B212427